MTDTPNLTNLQWSLVAAYGRRDMSVAEIRTTYDVTHDELYRALAIAKVPFRRPASARPSRNLRRRHGVPAVVPYVLTQTGPVDRGELEARLERLLAARLAELEDRAGPGRSADPAETDRALQSAARTLTLLRRGASPAREDERADLPEDRRARSVAELQDELRRQLDRVEEEEQGSPPPGARPDGADPS